MAGVCGGTAHPVQVYTDHKNLEYLSTARTTSRRHARWAATLAAYPYTITYKKGASNGKPDALSRRPDLQPSTLPSLPIISPLATTPYLFHTLHLIGAAVLVRPDDPLLPKVVVAQASDPALSALTTQILGGAGGESNPALLASSPLGSLEGPYAMRGGPLYNQGRICLPPTSTALSLKIL